MFLHDLLKVFDFAIIGSPSRPRNFERVKAKLYGFVDPKNDLIGVFMIQREGGSEERIAFMELAEAAVTE